MFIQDLLDRWIPIHRDNSNIRLAAATDAVVADCEALARALGTPEFIVPIRDAARLALDYEDRRAVRWQQQWQWYAVSMAHIFGWVLSTALFAALAPGHRIWTLCWVAPTLFTAWRTFSIKPLPLTAGGLSPHFDRFDVLREALYAAAHKRTSEARY